jgi:hypothetical protein
MHRGKGVARDMHRTSFIPQVLRRLAATRRRTALLVTAALMVSGTAGITALATQASAATGPVFTVMNTSETLPDGVWFRRSPHTADTDRVTGHGVYKNERVQLECYAWGDAVGPYNDRLWYFVLNVTRPTNDGVTNQGYLNAHYINDGKSANQIDARVSPCGPTPRPTPTITITPPKSVFFSGSRDPRGGSGHQVATQDIGLNELAQPHCSPAVVAKVSNGVSTLAGWSRGRVGVVFVLANLVKASTVHRIVLIDPGNTAAIIGSCDHNYNVNALLANWLSHPGNQLLILTGRFTEEKPYAHGWLGSSTYKGLRKYYLADIKGRTANRALICDYNLADHQEIMKDSWGVVQFPPDGCPILTHEAAPTVVHP